MDKFEKLDWPLLAVLFIASIIGGIIGNILYIIIISPFLKQG